MATEYDFENTPNVVIKDFFTKEEINDIYVYRKNWEENRIVLSEENPHGNTRIDESTGYETVTAMFPQNIRDKIQKQMEKLSPYQLRFDGLHMPRYSHASGSRPKLRPHYDVGLTHACFTLSIQLNTSKPWDLLVDGREFSLNYNEALFFSGSHQVHWRPDMEFSENDFFDVIIVQMAEMQDPLPLDDAHRAKMSKKADIFCKRFFG